MQGDRGDHPGAHATGDVLPENDRAAPGIHLQLQRRRPDAPWLQESSAITMFRFVILVIFMVFVAAAVGSCSQAMYASPLATRLPSLRGWPRARIGLWRAAVPPPPRSAW